MHGKDVSIMGEREQEEKKTEKQTERSPEKSMDEIVKDIEKNIFSLKFYPVAVDEDSKNEAVTNILKLYKDGNETVRQLILFMLHESLSQYFEFKTVHVYDYFKAKNPHDEPARLRMEVYRAMFNYNTSAEGLMEIITLLGKMSENDDAAKLLTYHYSRVSAIETEAHLMLRNSIINALGESNSPYALSALLQYAKYTDNERTFQRIMAAIGKWSEKIHTIKISEGKRKKLKKELEEVIREFKTTHYG